MATKDKVLKLLVDKKSDGKSVEDSSVSGEKLAAECGVSRAAIWKAVNALRNDGFRITGTPNGGYYLCDDDVFTQELFVQTMAHYRLRCACTTAYGK